MRGTRNDPVTILEEFYPTPTDIPAGTRCLTLLIPDSAEWYGLALGALWELMRWQNYEKVGIDVDLTIDRWLHVFATMEVICVDTMPIGATMIWHMDEPPARWLICDGSSAAKADYPLLYAHWGGKYGESVDFFGLPNLRSRLPYGADFDIELDEAAGEATHTLITAEMPAHNHGITDLGHQHRIPKAHPTTASAGNTSTPSARVDNPATPVMMTNVSTTGIAINNTGGGLPHNNIPPVRGVHFIVFAG